MIQYYRVLPLTRIYPATSQTSKLVVLQKYTLTTCGLTEYTVSDIFDYVQRHKERAFVLKVSAIEIYNEAIRDLLSTDNTPLRMLDDPERGTIVEKVTEATLRDWSHLKELLSMCEAQRQIGETLLNERSSRSHQIIRLTVESSAREFLGKDNSGGLCRYQPIWELPLSNIHS